MTSKEIRAEARGFLKGQWAKTSAMWFVYTLIASAAASIFMGIGVVGLGLSVDEYNGSPLYLASTLLTYLVQAMLMLGFTSIMLKIASGRSWGVGELFAYAKYAFKVLGLILLMSIYIMLWTLLFIIPGIVKAFSYSMALYIMAEDPSKGIRQCITESKEMMKGNKGRLFKLVFSFIGWILLASVGIMVAFIGAAAGVSQMGNVGALATAIIVVVLLVIAILVLEIVFLVYVETS